jgi:hypothetical protein
VVRFCLPAASSIVSIAPGANMKPSFLFAGLVLLSGVAAPGVAFAGCGDTQVTGDQLALLLPGRYACAADERPEWGWKYQELHLASGTLRDFKRGLRDSVDPSKDVGNWRIVGDAVEYSYLDASGSSGPFPHTVHGNGLGAYSICKGGSEVASLQDDSGNGCVAGGATTMVFRGRSTNTEQPRTNRGVAAGQR